MAERPTPDTERLVPLAGRNLGDATTHVLEQARRLGYSIAATAPGTYRLARDRRHGIRKRHEAVVVTILDDRSGAKARFVGPVDPALLDQVSVGDSVVDARTWAPSHQPAPQRPAPPPQSSPTPATPPPDALTASATGYVRPSDRPPNAAPVGPPAGGLIGHVPGAVRSEPNATPSATDAVTIARTPAAPTLPHDTVPALVFPDGRRIALTGDVVFGRDPDPGAADRDSVTIVVLSEPSLSKTHARVGRSGIGLTVTDLHSTNGTMIDDGVAPWKCPAGDPVPIPSGARIVAGRMHIEVVT